MQQSGRHRTPSLHVLNASFCFGRPRLPAPDKGLQSTFVQKCEHTVVLCVLRKICPQRCTLRGRSRQRVKHKKSTKRQQTEFSVFANGPVSINDLVIQKKGNARGCVLLLVDWCSSKTVQLSKEIGVGALFCRSGPVLHIDPVSENLGAGALYQVLRTDQQKEGLTGCFRLRSNKPEVSCASSLAMAKTIQKKAKLSPPLRGLAEPPASLCRQQE